jgi:peptidoglycan hydrolase-like protein with peptidoglycan-binding domain
MINKDNENRRFLIFKHLRKIGAVTLPNNQKNYEDWKNRKFGSNDESVLNFFEQWKEADKDAKDWSIDEFFRDFVCDLRPDSEYCQPEAHPTDDVQTTSNNQNNSSSELWYMPIFSYVRKQKSKHELSKDGDYFLIYDSDIVLKFYNNGNFSYIRNDGSKDDGKWVAKSNGDGFTIKCDNGDTFDTEKNNWDLVQNNSTPSNQSSDIEIKPEEVANGEKIVKQGMKGNIVTQIQKLLIKHGFTNVSPSGEPDGIFGYRTSQSVYDFQQKMGLVTDRIVGENTWAKLIKEPTSTQTKMDPNTGLRDTSLDLPKFNTDINRFNKYGVSRTQQDTDLKKLGLNENFIKKIVSKHLRSKL